jgi:DNA-binding protein HU-beta
MTKKDFVEKLAEKVSVSRKDAETIYDTFFDLIKTFVVAEGKLNVSGFGTFRLKSRKARTARNPRTGEQVKVGPSKSLGFKASPALKASL